MALDAEVTGGGREALTNLQRTIVCFNGSQHITL